MTTNPFAVFGDCMANLQQPQSSQNTETFGVLQHSDEGYWLQKAALYKLPAEFSTSA